VEIKKEEILEKNGSQVTLMIFLIRYTSSSLVPSVATPGFWGTGTETQFDYWRRFPIYFFLERELP